MASNDSILSLNHAEIKLIELVSNAKGYKFDNNKKDYTEADLEALGFIRENWILEELEQKGLTTEGVLTSFDEIAERAKTELPVDAPFASNILKWQLPISLEGARIVMTSFPPSTVVLEHAHQSIDGFARCGQVRIVIDGSIEYAGKTFKAGDWFYIPNGVPYSFSTDPEIVTREAYFYQYGYNLATPLRFSNFTVNLEN